MLSYSPEVGRKLEAIIAHARHLDDKNGTCLELNLHRTLRRLSEYACETPNGPDPQAGGATLVPELGEWDLGVLFVYDGNVRMMGGLVFHSPADGWSVHT
jgi:hypothetical protein